MTMPLAGKFPPLSELLGLKDRRAVVTGGARGIGEAITFRLAEAGANVFIADIDGEIAEKTAATFRKVGYPVFATACDVCKEGDAGRTVREAVSALGGIDILVNNAGIFPRMSLDETSEADFSHVLSVNLSGAFLMSREAARIMVAQHRDGNIINIASIDGIHPSSSGLAAYDASKAGLIMLTKSLAKELGKDSIRVNAVAPGGILTAGVFNAVSQTPTESGKKELKAFMSRMVLGRMGDADDIARVVLFLASGLSSYMTGSIVVVDGGYLIS